MAANKTFELQPSPRGEGSPLDNFPESLRKLVDDTWGKDGDCKKKDFSKLEKECAKLIKETSELGAVKLFLLWVVRCVCGLKEKEAAAKIDALAKELRGDAASVLDDYPDGEEKWHSDKYPPKNKKNKEFSKKTEDEFDRAVNMEEEEFGEALENEEPAALCVIGMGYFEKFFKEDEPEIYVKYQTPGEEDYMGVEWNEEHWQKAVSVMRLAAQKGFAYAQYALANYYLEGAKRLEEVIEENRPLCDYGYDWLELAIDEDTCRVIVFYAQALYWLRQAAFQGYIDAIDDMSSYYNCDDVGGFDFYDELCGSTVIVTRLRGEETEKQKERREFSERISAEAAVIYEKGEEALKKGDLLSAVNYFKDALHVSYCDKKYDKPLADALCALGLKPLAEEDRERAEELYRKGIENLGKTARRDEFWEAALLGHVPSAQELCTGYIISVHTSQTGQTLREMLAEAGYAKAQYDLASQYYYGNEIKKDVKKAAELYQKAAAQGYEYAIRSVETLKKKGEIKAH
jgi:TPR repeat protein